jgi:hypothetical protein
MTDTMDIRVWARAQGLEIASKGKIPDAIRERWDARDREDGLPAAPDHDGYLDATQPEPQSELPPETQQPWWKRPRQPKPGPSQPAKRRVSIADVVSQAWGFGAMMLGKNSQTLPMARVLQMQAPVAGVLVNDMAKDTVVDRLLQPVARMGQSGQKAVALFGPPVLVGAIMQKPQLYPVLKPALAMSLMTWIEISEPAMRKAEKRAKEFAEKFGEIDIDGIIDALFAPPPGYTPPSEDEEQNIQRARDAG